MNIAEKAQRILDSVSSANQIMDSKLRTSYAPGDEVVKILKDKVTVEYNGMQVECSTSLYTLLKYGIIDVNDEELRNYGRIEEKLPEDLRKHFALIKEAIHYNGKSISIAERVLNDDGSEPKRLEEYGPLKNDYFWKRFKVIEDFLIENSLFLYDISNPRNMLVKNHNGRLIPVLFDYKMMGAKFFPLQLDLLFIAGRINKMTRRMQRVRDTYRIAD
ncbi:hypothetical protein JXA85_02345 [Candidatus Woesearchaeota archaeon]|nr:hypothetical protein [Candidatus Woesearchaeota archaeon]